MITLTIDFLGCLFRRLLYRTGWVIENYLTMGHTDDADLCTEQNDARSFCLITSHRLEE